MENPFEIMNSSGLRPPSLNEGRVSQIGPEPEPSLVKGGQGEFTPSYNTRRADLRPAVRDYADKLHARLMEIYKKYGATDVKGMYANVSAGKRVRIAKTDVEEADRLRDELNQVLDSRELPRGMIELPPLEAFEKLIAKLAKDGLRVTGLGEWDEYEMIDGELNGRFKIGRNWMPVINGELVTKIGDSAVIGCDHIRNVNGKLSGRINFGRIRIPVINGNPIFRIEGREILDCDNVRNIDKRFNGEVKLEDRWFPVIDGTLITTVQDRAIEHCSDVHNIDGKLNGQVRVVNSIPSLPVINGQLITEIETDEIEGCGDIRNVDGKLNGAVQLEGHAMPVINGEIVSQIGGKQIDECFDTRNINGKLNGIVRIAGLDPPVIDGNLITTFAGERIESCTDVRNINGILNCRLMIRGRWYPVIEGELITHLDGKEVVGCNQGVFNIGGKLCGNVVLEGDNGKEERYSVLLGKISRQN